MKMYCSPEIIYLSWLLWHLSLLQHLALVCLGMKHSEHSFDISRLHNLFNIGFGTRANHLLIIVHDDSVCTLQKDIFCSHL